MKGEINVKYVPHISGYKVPSTRSINTKFQPLRYEKSSSTLIELNPIEHILKKLTNEEQKELLDYLYDEFRERGKKR